MTKNEEAFRQHTHEKRRCGSGKEHGQCKCFTLPIQAFTKWPTWQAATARAVGVLEGPSVSKREAYIATQNEQPEADPARWFTFCEGFNAFRQAAIKELSDD